LDGKHVVFGELIEGMELLKRMGNVKVNGSDKPLQEVKISGCGVWPTAAAIPRAPTPAPEARAVVQSNTVATASTFGSTSNVYFKISIGGADAGNIVFRLFDETTPKTAQNFRALCTGIIHCSLQENLLALSDFSLCVFLCWLR
jgi:hypothetical protein